MSKEELIQKINNVKPGEVAHFYPEEDIQEHIMNEFCSCMPYKLIDCDIWVHHAHDGRQAVVWANEILKDE